ncbi:hypothetical protein NKJ28_32405, partial [Mesorhizobium sp. M0145]|uniref:hypothetical protein n=1 Tax=Mesorhizobium sp. M0145 TaxID=2956895 RepID=UPI003338A068
AALARKHDPSPGNMVVWRGMTCLHDIAFASPLDQADDVGNRKLHRRRTKQLKSARLEWTLPDDDVCGRILKDADGRTDVLEA